MRLHRANSHAPEAVVEGASRAMRISMNRELENLETHIPFLGTVGSISPYIGLFGTVWDHARLYRPRGGKTTTLQMVAPGIAEALIATAIGLFAAIPAVMAYNRLNQRVNKLELNYDNFMEEFTAILHRRAFTVSESNKGCHGQSAWTRSSRSQVRNQHCTVAGRTAGAVADLYGDSAHHHPERGGRSARRY
ncbi:hypothetical protein DMI60_13820 [Escherichia coli]|nr:hypothetical protein [Escherichia coli]